MKRAPAALALAGALAAGCSNPPVQGGPDGDLRFTVGGLELHAVSGAAVQTAYGLALYVSDQPDTCAAISAVPQTQWTLLALRVAPQAGGASQAVVTAPKAAPAAGEAVGAVTGYARDVATLGYDAADGSVAWTQASDGTVTLTAVDVGFQGAAGRVTGEGLVLKACP
ncbi:MAG: hypothetical protein QM704_21760 [Anaeromyxobacteraceae bacterium]